MTTMFLVRTKLDGGWFSWPTTPLGADDELRIRILPGGKFDKPTPWNPADNSVPAVRCAFERRQLAVAVNDKRAVLAGHQHATNLSAAIAYSPHNDLELQLHVGGNLPTGEILGWQIPQPTWGDEIAFRMLPPADEFDAPTVIYG